jgi:hypothetical protein
VLFEPDSRIQIFEMRIVQVFVVGAKDIMEQTEMIVFGLSSSDIASTVGIY